MTDKTDWYPKRTMGPLLDEAAAKWGDREAVSYKGITWTFADWQREADRLAKGLMAYGVEPGDRVAVWMVNRPEWLFIMFAIAKVGACIVPLNTRYRTDDVAYTLAQSRSALLISVDKSGPVDYRAMLADTMPDIGNGSDGALELETFPELRRVVFLGDERLPNTTSWDDMLAAGAAISDAELQARADAVDPDSLLMIGYTSGTTGHPKGVMQGHIVIRNVHERAQLLGMSFEDVHLNYLPMFHLYGYSELAMISVIAGAKQVLMDAFDADEALDTAEREGVTIMHGFEAHWLDLLTAQEKRPRNLKLRFGTLPSGVDSTIPIADKVQDVFGPTISGYGMTEAWAFITVTNLGHSREQRVNASGYPMNDYEFRIIDPETGRDQPTGVSGEILIRGYAVMKGYWDKPEETAAAIDEDGWLHSGDMGLFRADGHMVFQGRYKDMLKVGGENVSPAEMEAYLRDMPEILDAAIVSYPDPRLTEVPVAFVLASGDGAVVPDEIIGRCKGRVASFKIPRHVIELPEFPMTPSGKVRKIELRATALEMLGEPGGKQAGND
ncbi:MAG: AMP-binding protein [Rhodospirillaceae bacterium]|nr:AMP-binding protein [Rhodospirillaceae bacterium]MDD9918958.1 AMP-binding protein [Rhodospirillaceae bacterium]MDD9925010.1 AMP-binding protein [Rhodospirillaceae bacterium]